MVGELLKNSQTPNSPLKILQVELEALIQLIVHTLMLYENSRVRLPNGTSVPTKDLGYEGPLCNMGLVNAAAVWDGFRGNIIHIIRGNRSFSEQEFNKRLKKVSADQIKEPLARRHCIVHNMAKVDSKYLKNIPNSQLKDGDSLDINLSYLKEANEALFNTGVEVVRLLVSEGLLVKTHQETLGKFQRDPALRFSQVAK